jgi:hypothetical protein
MSVRLPRRGGGNESNEKRPGAAAANTPEPATGARALRDTDTVPDRACCCGAPPTVKVLMPPTATRAFPVDLWLCGTHWPASRDALARTGAATFAVPAPKSATDPSPEGALSG